MKTAVITAYNPRNAGMYSVDRAAQRFFGAAKRDYRLFRVLHGRRGPFLLRGERIHRLTDSLPLGGYDTVVYWGDFLNSPVYATDDFHVRERYYAGDGHELASSLDTWKRFFLLKDAPRRPRRVVSVSNNFQSTGRTLDALGADQRREIADLLGGFDGIFPRDPTSTREVEALLGPDRRARVECGVDAAVLSRMPGTAREQRKRDTFTWFFHRSGLTKAEEQRLVAAVAEATGLRPVHLGRWLSLNYLTWDWQFSGMVAKMAQAAFCLSDTYHCLINAMVKDAPVIGLGRAADVQTGTLGDFKKRELFAMFDLDDWYVELSPTGLSGEAVEQVVARARTIGGSGHVAGLYARLDQRTQAYRQLLQTMLA